MKAIETTVNSLDTELKFRRNMWVITYGLSAITALRDGLGAQYSVVGSNIWELLNEISRCNIKSSSSGYQDIVGYLVAKEPTKLREKPALWRISNIRLINGLRGSSLRFPVLKTKPGVPRQTIDFQTIKCAVKRRSHVNGSKAQEKNHYSSIRSLIDPHWNCRGDTRPARGSKLALLSNGRRISSVNPGTT